MQLQITQSQLLTPHSAIKSVYLVTLQHPQGERLSYQPGDWLTVQAVNPAGLVRQILERLNLSGSEVVRLRKAGEVSVSDALGRHLEITQLNPAILNKMQRQLQLGEWSGRAAMIEYAYGRDILDLLTEFPQMAQMGIEFLDWLAPLAPRYYSIASASDKTVQVLFKAVRYRFNDREKSGVASNFLAGLSCGDLIEAEFKENPMFKLPDDPLTPIVMFGAGTGLAPFLGFMQQRVQQANGGDNLLFFGETEKAHACLCCDQLEEWKAAGRLDLFLAFSRDQADKRYVQHLMQEQKEKLWALWEAGAVIYICGSQQHLAPALEALWQKWFMEELGLDASAALALWQQSRKQKRIQLDVY
ncbi:NADP oxidoreductase [Thiomicrorhabdus xiamenensis]|uniref:NADP oxidoreductase n=1 Tax=Thiomicrorhabdus xiamenensis TaxID=2739063 RepID=A0A7D4SHI9_9GAMM|nr:NADP oxidoreductase [Thiomicrorhabdus xiamenensis]QKI88400.1 NADP oxidoreductase [Thiomicrorhabdus xiamenensis]